MKILILFGALLSAVCPSRGIIFPECASLIEKIPSNFVCNPQKSCEEFRDAKTPICGRRLIDKDKKMKSPVLYIFYLPDTDRRRQYFVSIETKNSLKNSLTEPALFPGEIGDFVYHIQEGVTNYNGNFYILGEGKNIDAKQNHWLISMNFWNTILQAHENKKAVVDFYPFILYQEKHGTNWTPEKSDMGMLCARGEGELVKNCGDFDLVDPVIYQSGEGVPADVAMDAYRFGVYLFRIFSKNKSPFDGATAQELLKNWGQGDYTIPKNMNRSMAYLIALCLTTDRSKRQNLTFLNAVFNDAITGDDMTPLAAPVAMNNKQDPDTLDAFADLGQQIRSNSGVKELVRESKTEDGSSDFLLDILERHGTLFWTIIGVVGIVALAAAIWTFWPSVKPAEGQHEQDAPSAPSKEEDTPVRDPGDPKLDIELTNG